MHLKCGDLHFMNVEYMFLRKHLKTIVFLVFVYMTLNILLYTLIIRCHIVDKFFTLFHELCHILIKTSGIDKANDDYISRLELDNRKLEMICNMFAGKFLVPTNDLLKLIDNVK